VKFGKRVKTKFHYAILLANQLVSGSAIC